MGGCLAASAGLVLGTLMPTFPAFLAVFGVITGGGCGAMLIASLVVVNQYFYKRRPLASGIREAKFIMDGISKKLIKDGIHSTIRVIFLALVSF